MIISTSITAAIYLDQKAKAAAEAVRSRSAEIVRKQAIKCASPLHKSPFEDCPDCGIDLRSEALRGLEENPPRG